MLVSPTKVIGIGVLLVVLVEVVVDLEIQNPLGLQEELKLPVKVMMALDKLTPDITALIQ